MLEPASSAIGCLALKRVCQNSPPMSVQGFWVLLGLSSVHLRYLQTNEASGLSTAMQMHKNPGMAVIGLFLHRHMHAEDSQAVGGFLSSSSHLSSFGR